MFTYTGTFSQYTQVHIRVVYVCMDMYVGIYGMWVGRYVYVYTLWACFSDHSLQLERRG